MRRRAKPRGLPGSATDNNHILQLALYLWFLGPPRRRTLYRLLRGGERDRRPVRHRPDRAAVGRDGERSRAWYSVGTSFPLLMYFSEARGYAPAMFLGTRRLALHSGGRETVRGDASPSFWLVSILGVLAHLTFVFVSGALLTVRRARYVGASDTVPLLFIGVWYLAFVAGDGASTRSCEYRIVRRRGEGGSLLSESPSIGRSLLSSAPSGDRRGGHVPALPRSAIGLAVLSGGPVGHAARGRPRS